MKRPLLILLTIILFFLGSAPAIAAAPAGSAGFQENTPSPEALIAAVNQLRLQNGLNALNTHPALMQAAQWEAEAIASGAPGHTHPPGLTLGQWLISLGYPLAGSIAQDGLRSENWVAGTEMTVDEAVQIWLGDAPHTNTMLSSSRSDIGAGVAVRKNAQGKPVYTYVLETALQTSSGEQQEEALKLLTQMPGASAEGAQVPQYIVPVSVGTARPDGDVIHEVQQGQSLWAVAIAYGVKIDQIQQLNNLTSHEIWAGQKLLVQKGATQPVPTPTGTPSPTPRETAVPTPTEKPDTPTPLPTPTPGEDPEPPQDPLSTTALFLGLAVLVPGLLVWLLISESRREKED